MKMLSFVLLLALTSLPALAALVELTDDDLRDVDGRILPSGLTVELEREVMNRIANSLKNAEAFERVLAELENNISDVTEASVETIMRRFYLGLGGLGISPHILERQMEYNLYLQQQALLQAQTLEQQRALFWNLMNGLRDSLLEYRSTGNMGALLININTSFTLKVLELGNKN